MLDQISVACHKTRARRPVGSLYAYESVFRLAWLRGLSLPVVTEIGGADVPDEDVTMPENAQTWP